MEGAAARTDKHEHEHKHDHEHDLDRDRLRAREGAELCKGMRGEEGGLPEAAAVALGGVPPEFTAAAINIAEH